MTNPWKTASFAARALKKAYRIVFQSNLPRAQALASAEEEVEGFEEVRHFISSIRRSEGGVVS